MSNPDISTYKAVIFDVDGTLYDQPKLRLMMAFELARYYLLHPWKINDLRILLTFRNLREHQQSVAEQDLESFYYSLVAKRLRVDVSQVEEVVRLWIYQKPLEMLTTCAFPDMKECIAEMRKHGIKIGVFSDYPVNDKLKALGVNCDVSASSTDHHIQRMKPDPEGLRYILAQLGFNAEDCMFIGDRYEKDGIAAERAGMPYYIIKKRDQTFYTRLLRQLRKSQLTYAK